MDRLCIINGNDGDDQVVVDGRVITFDLAGFLPADNIWAVQWYGAQGEVEYSDQPNEMIANLDDFADVLAEFNRLAALEDAPLSLADLVAAKRAEIDASRDQHLADPSATVTVQVGGDDVVFQAGPRSMSDLNDAITVFTAVGGTPPGYEWRDENNINHPADLALLASIAAAKAADNNVIWQQSWALKDALDAIDIPINPDAGTDANIRAAIEAIVWP
ncbi:hypothetical protein [Motiliproteus sp.]|uniref:DUF4376 domain-containing protein n=1 Tax=Motiliproteus sp. TaxID=1898955 RepID=UPI003BA97FD7